MSRIPESAQWRTLALVAVLTLGSLVCWEVYLRAANLGQYPDRTVSDPVERIRRPAADGNRRVFILGSSRTQLGISPSVVHEQLGDGWEVRHAGIPMGSGPAQMHACADWFERGDIVVVECLPLSAYTNLRGTHESELESRVQDPGVGEIETDMMAPISSHLYFARGAVTPAGRLHDIARETLGMEQLEEGGEGFSESAVVHSDGWIEFQGKFEERRTAWLVAYLLKTAPQDRDLPMDGVLRRLREDVRRLNSRGVRVVLLRMPSYGDYARAEERLFPRARFWNRLERELPDRSWHFADFETTRNLETYDNTHLTARSARTYSKWLGTRLRSIDETAER